MTELTAERARELFDYDPLTGVLTWRVRRGGYANAGTPAGSRTVNGRVVTKIGERSYLNHRIAWLWYTGCWPSDEIDHINGNPADNRLVNLRDVSRTTNKENTRRANLNNKAGLLGVSWLARWKKFRARIRTNGKLIHIGYYQTAEEAHAAYLHTKRQLHAGNTL